MKKSLIKFFTEILPDILFRLVMVAAIVSCVKVSIGGTKLLLAFLGTVSVAIMIAGVFVKNDELNRKRLRQIRFGWLIMIGACFISLNLYYNYSFLEEAFPMQHSVDQHIYQARERNSRIMPDAYIRELIRYKEVAVPYEVKDYIHYNPITDEEERGAGFVNAYYVENNYTRYFLEYSGKGYTDLSLPNTEKVGNTIFDKSGFEDIGIANDMLRYTFLINREHSKETKYFWYSWFYYSFAELEERFPHIFVNRSSCEEGSLVAVWDKKENLYLMGRSYYENSLLSMDLED